MKGIFDTEEVWKREEKRNTIDAALWAICILTVLLWSFLWF